MLEKIVSLYLNELPKLPVMLDEEEAIKYFARLLMNGNIITYVEDGELLGFIEFWRVTTEQFGRICLDLPISHDEDLLSGPICLVSRMWIAKDVRNTKVFLTLGCEFLVKNAQCIKFGWIQMHKKHKPIQTYSREELFKQL